MNKKTAGLFLIMVLGAWSTAPCSYAEPERIQLKEANKQTRERIARAQIKNIDLRNIEDPEARKAIGEILNYLGLQSKK